MQTKREEILNISLGRQLTVIFIVVSFCLCNTEAFSANDPFTEHFKYITDGINVIKQTDLQPHDSKNELEIANVACNLLTKLVDDPNLEKLVSTALSGKVPPNVNSLFQDIGLLNNFVEQETLHFKQVGIQPTSTVQALSSALSVSSQFKADKITSTQVINDIKLLKTGVCLHKDNVASSRKWEERRPFIIMGISGLGFILADGAALYLTGGGAMFAANTSGAVGANLIAAAGNGFR